MQLFSKFGVAVEINISTDALRGGKFTREEVRACTRCGGAGGSARWIHTGSICYDCGGSGKARRPVRATYYTADALAKYTATKEKRDAKKAAAARATADAFNATPDGQILAGLCADQNADSFYFSLRSYGWKHGALSVEQSRALSESIEKARERAARKAAAAEQAARAAAASQHVGTIGERITFTATIDRVIEIGTRFGTMAITILRDGEGNVYVQKGAHIGCRGETFAIVATVKDHDERDGTKQTIIQRPRATMIEDGEQAA